MDARYWQNRYETGDTPWDIGGNSPAIMDVLTQLAPKDLRILIPGAGHGYEVCWLHREGFSQVTVCDWAPSALEHIRKSCPGFPKEHLVESDFFELEGCYDLIIEQTFLSALPPETWPRYMDQCAKLLSPSGCLTGLLFASPFGRPGPPFGAYQQEYEALFSRRFWDLEIHLTSQSLGPRKGNELFFKACRPK